MIISYKTVFGKTLFSTLLPSRDNQARYIYIHTAMASAKLATIGILSIGDMGMGIAKLLVAKGFSVATNCAGRR